MGRRLIAIFDRLAKPVYLRLRTWTSNVVDRRLGIVTTDEVVATDVVAEIGWFREKQRALAWTAAHRMIRRLHLRPDDVFLDIGCGAGRVNCMVARLASIRRVIGIERDPLMVARARSNAAGLRGRRSPIEIAEVDATTYDVPDDVTWVYMYNPFGGEVLEAAMRQLVASVDRRPRRMGIACFNPKEHELMPSLVASVQARG